MTRTGTIIRKSVTTLLALAVGALALSAPALSATSEIQQGRQIAGEVQSGKLNGSNLTSEQYTHVGQYLMSRAFSSTKSYEAMDDLMDRMMGTTGSDQMYRYLGERYYGKNVQPSGRYGPMYGWMGGMMRAYGATTPYAGMMGAYLDSRGSGSSSTPSGSYPMGGMMGYGTPASSVSGSGDWPTGAIVAVAVLGTLLIGILAAVALPRLHGGRPPGQGART